MRYKIKHLFLCLLVFLQCSCAQETLRLGADQIDKYFPLLDNKSIGVVGNQSSLIGSTHLVDSLLSTKQQVVKVFSPEHGFRGTADAGAHIESGVDEKTGLPIVSLYGNNKKPTANQLQGIDILLFDIQDVHDALSDFALGCGKCGRRSAADRSLAVLEHHWSRRRYSCTQFDWGTVLQLLIQVNGVTFPCQFCPQSTGRQMRTWCSCGDRSGSDEWSWREMRSQSHPCCPGSTDPVCAWQKVA